MVAGVGTLRQVEDRVLTPSIRAITRDVAGGSYEITEARVDENGKPILDKDGKPIFITVNRPTKVLDLINQRPLIEGEIERRIRPEAQKSCVTIREVRLGEPAIPPELLVAVRREQLATQLARAFIQERAAQEKRVDSEKAKATADQQTKLVESEINVQRSVQNAEAARNEGQGERDKLSLISEGQQKQVGVLGPESTVKAAPVRADARHHRQICQCAPRGVHSGAGECPEVRAKRAGRLRWRWRGGYADGDPRAESRGRSGAWRRHAGSGSPPTSTTLISASPRCMIWLEGPFVY